jgi:hypothetical protein
MFSAAAIRVSMKEDVLSMAPAVGALGPARGLVASGAHVSIAPSGRGDSV